MERNNIFDLCYVSKIFLYVTLKIHVLIEDNFLDFLHFALHLKSEVEGNCLTSSLW